MVASQFRQRLARIMKLTRLEPILELPRIVRN
jgi:hypothetical protein